MARQQIHGDDLADATIERGNRLGGLTIRAEFAKAAMVGLLAHSCNVNPEQKSENAEDVAARAVICADALIAALNKED